MIAVVAAAGAFTVAPAARAHVTVQPDSAPSHAFVREELRVPNEQDKADTTKLDVQLPDGFTDVSYEPVPGWSVKIGKQKLSTRSRMTRGKR